MSEHEHQNFDPDPDLEPLDDSGDLAGEAQIPPAVVPEGVVVLPPTHPVGLFGAVGPVGVISKATEIATALKDVLKRQGLISNIQGREYPRCEAWTLLGTMLGVFPVLVWTREIPGGWEARVEARTRDGAIVGAAEAECLKIEKNWQDRDAYAVRSMAQTRATAKALRMPLGFVMTLAGYEPTPAEEMPGESTSRQQSTAKAGTVERNASTCPVIGVFSGDEHRKAMSQLQGGNPRGATPQERQILLSRLQQGFPKQGISLAQPDHSAVSLVWHKGGNLRITGEHRLIGEGLLRVPGLVACMLLRLGSSEGSAAPKSGSDNRVSGQEREPLDNQEGAGTGQVGHSGDSGSQRQHNLPTRPTIATEATRAWMAKNLEPCMQEALQYFIEIGAILPTETIDDVPLRFVPINRVEMTKLISDITHFAIGGKVPEKPIIHTIDPAQGADEAVANVPRNEVGQSETPEVDGDYDLTQWPFTCIVPVPRKGMTRDAYLKAPDTIGSLFAVRHGTDEQSHADRQRLWGFIAHFEPKSWVDRQGQTRLPSKADLEFRKALDLLADMLDKKGDKL